MQLQNEKKEVFVHLNRLWGKNLQDCFVFGIIKIVFETGCFAEIGADG